MKRFISFAHIVLCLLLLSCNKHSTALQKIAHELNKQKCTIVASNDTQEWIVWWSPDSILYFKDFKNNRQKMLYSEVNRYDADSISVLSMVGTRATTIFEGKDIIYDIDSVSIALDNNALVIYQSFLSYNADFTDFPCYLLILPTLKLIEIKKTTKTNECICTHDLELVNNKLYLKAELQYVITTNDSNIVFNLKNDCLVAIENYLRTEVVEDGYEIDGVYTIMELPNLFVCNSREYLFHIAKVCDNLVCLYSKTGVYFDNLEDDFFIESVNRLLKYSNGNYDNMSNNILCKQFIEDCILDIDESLLRVALARGKVFELSNSQIIELILNHEHIEIDIDDEFNTLLSDSKEVNEYYLIYDILYGNAEENQPFTDNEIYNSNNNIENRFSNTPNDLDDLFQDIDDAMKDFDKLGKELENELNQLEKELENDLLLNLLL